MVDGEFVAVEVENSLPIEDEDINNLDSLIRSVQAQNERNIPPGGHTDLRRIPEVIDDYIRNYLVKREFIKTLQCFDTEWYAKFGRDDDPQTPPLSDVYVEFAKALDEIEDLKNVVKKDESLIDELNSSLEKATRERNFHRINHNRIVQEKEKINTKVTELKEHVTTIDPVINELNSKYEVVQREKMVYRMERDKLRDRVNSLEEKLRNAESQLTERGYETSSIEKKPRLQPSKKSNQSSFTWPSKRTISVNNISATNALGWVSRNSFKAHSMAVTSLAIHPKRPVVVSASDDGTWRMLAAPQGDLILTGEGHSSWLAGIAMHPKGIMVATASGDNCLKLWDFGETVCRQTLKAHTDGVWCVDFHDTGELLASGSLDNTVRVWDIEYGKCQQTLRGHVDSVKSVCWKQGTNTLWSSSADKTISLWDARMNCCAQSLYGHKAGVNSIALSQVTPEVLASCDFNGEVTTWDLKMMNARESFVCGKSSANDICIDASGNTIAVASEDSNIYIFSLIDNKTSVLKDHKSPVQCVCFDPQMNSFLISGASDGSINYWS